MAYNEELAVRVLTIIGAEPSLVRKPMFGGMAYMLQGNLACCVLNDDLIVRVPKDEYATALQQPTSVRWTTPAAPCADGSWSAPPQRQPTLHWPSGCATARQQPSLCRPSDAPHPRGPLPLAALSLALEQQRQPRRHEVDGVRLRGKHLVHPPQGVLIRAAQLRGRYDAEPNLVAHDDPPRAAPTLQRQQRLSLRRDVSPAEGPGVRSSRLLTHSVRQSSSTVS